jgi:hypothetical protein
MDIFEIRGEFDPALDIIEPAFVIGKFPAVAIASEDCCAKSHLFNLTNLNLRPT